MDSSLDALALELKEMIQDKLDLYSLLMFEQTSKRNKRLVAETFK